MTAFLPITDFQFVFCGFATLAATVGYACAKRRSSVHGHDVASAALDVEDKPSSQPISSPDHFTTEKSSNDTGPISRKRKSVDDHDSSVRHPRKRSRSPSAGDDSSKSPQDTGTPTDSAEAPETKASCEVSPNYIEHPNSEGDEIQTQITNRDPSPIPSPPPLPPTISHSDIIDTNKPVPAIVALVTPVTPPRSPSPSNRARGFAAFAGTGSPFTSPFAPNESSATATAAFQNPQRPAWYTNGNESGSSVFREASPVVHLPAGDSYSTGVGAEAAVENTAAPGPMNGNGTAEGEGESEVALAAMQTRVKTTVTHLTGEEDETVKSELKGVKLFVKRGSKGFTGGMPGHIKILSRAGSGVGGEERILFRREPLWKVSMNVRVRPTVRCTFDEDDNVLRVVLMEAVECEDKEETRAQELVVYALKRGRVPKKEFREFAEALLKNPLFKSLGGPQTLKPEGV